jgi:hypothetical protein
MSEIVQEYTTLGSHWPGEKEIDKMVTLAAGLFIWATTAARYIRDGSHDDLQDPNERLMLVTSGRLRAGNVDELYSSILSRSFGEANGPAFQAILGTVVLSKAPMDVLTIWRLSGKHSESRVESILNKLSSVISRGRDNAFSIRHKSFVDFLTEAGRCPTHFFIDTTRHSYNLALACCRLMNDRTRGLKFNICDLQTSHVFNDDVPNIKTRIQERISGHLSYSCLHWADHLHDLGPNANFNVGPLLEELRELFRHRLLYWFEILSLLKQVDIANGAMLRAVSWFNVCYLL